MVSKSRRDEGKRGRNVTVGAKDGQETTKRERDWTDGVSALLLKSHPHLSLSFPSFSSSVLPCRSQVENLRIPFPYTHVVNLLTFIFVFGAPFIYTSRTQNWAENDVLLFASLLLGVAFYGLEDMARKVHPSVSIASFLPFFLSTAIHDRSTCSLGDTLYCFSPSLPPSPLS